MNNFVPFLKKPTKKEFARLVTFGIGNHLLEDKLCAFLLAITPILQHYKGIYKGINFNAGISVLIIVFPYMLLKLGAKLCKLRISFIGAVIPLIIYHIYEVMNYRISIIEIAYVLAMIFYYTIAASGCINVRYFVKTLTYVSAIASVFLIIQYICYYVLGFHLKLVPTNLLLESSEQWVALARTGLVSVTGRRLSFYRPSAFFLEPSHFFIYSFPALLIMLLAPNMTPWRLKMAMLITVGLFLSTSGMGIGFAIGCWVLYLVLYRNEGNNAKLKKLLTPKTIMIVIAVGVLLAILYFTLDFFRSSIDRVSSAIDGRTRGGIHLFKSLDGSSLWFGTSGNSLKVDVRLPGFFETIFKQGWVGVILSYTFYVTGLFKLKAQYFWMSFIIVLISFFTAHTHGTITRLYYVIILMDGYHAVKEKRKARFIAKEKNLKIIENT